MKYRTAIQAVALTDGLLTFPYVFAAEALPFGRSGPAAAWTYWLGQPWVYMLIAPVAVVVAWRGARQARALARRSKVWWWLSLELVALAVGATLVLSLFGAVGWSDTLGAAAQSGALAAVLGLLLTPLNSLLARRVENEVPVRTAA